MATQHHNALTRALAELPGPLPAFGVIHIAIPHTSRFTIVGNHLAQHAELSLVAIGIGVHIQSLPLGSLVGIKALTARFAEGEMRIAAALRELEAHGYLRRAHVRLANGRMTTRTVFCNQPGALERAGRVVVAPKVPPVPDVPPGPPLPEEPPEPEDAPAPPPDPEATSVPEESHTPVPEEFRPPVRVPPPTAPKPPRPPLPQPRELTPELRQTASAILADLRNHAEELVLSEADVEELVPGVAAWLEREVRPDGIRRALTTDLPKPPKYPAKIVRHRLTALLPPPLPGAEELAPAVRRPLVIPLQNCDGCDRAFRSREPGHCRGCRSDLTAAAA
ncbi:hypothetical protein [Streptomyces cyaneofuscatus]|uniref:hypothetical protein n=1 Tax=Streptomyces cyaneofuscatus TaxID=66883 RepID=UPI0036BABAB9